ncbi:MAG: hypothetical protein AAFR17_01890 [Pseudomonadota bacterium]
MDQITIAGILVLTFKLGIFAMMVMATRQASRAVREVKAEEAAKAARSAAKVDDAAPAPLREAA